MSLSKVSAAGVSVWLDDLSRERMVKGGKATYLPDLIANDFVVGVTTNPAIFSASIAGSSLYKDDMAALYREGRDAEGVISGLTTSDVKAACNLFLPTYEDSGGVDGRVSIEVDPRLARDTQGTIAQARALWDLVSAPNVLIKVPATIEGLPAIERLIADGISVNVTIIFSVKRYEAVLNAFLSGLETRVKNSQPLSGIHSVASFFVSRVDTEIDARLKGTPNENLRGKAALANARLAYEHFLKVESSPRWQSLAKKGAAIQRPLWASTGVKDPAYDPTMYVLDLVADKTVNTMPEATLNAVRTSKRSVTDSITGKFAEAKELIAKLHSIGIPIDEVASKLEEEGIDKFIKPWLELIKVVEAARA